MERIRFLVADGQLLFAEALSEALNQDDRLESLKEYPTSVSEVVDLTTLLHPHVLLMDYWLPVEGGPAAAATLRPLLGTKILVLSWDYSLSSISKILDSGAVGYLPKNSSVEHAAEAVVRAHAGDSPVFAEQLRKMVDSLEGQIKYAQQTFEAMGKLTDRELDVLGLLSLGYPIEEVARQLGISRNTVNNHIQKILAKSGARSHFEAVAIAKRFGLIGPTHSTQPGPEGYSQ